MVVADIMPGFRLEALGDPEQVSPEAVGPGANVGNVRIGEGQMSM